MKEIDYTKLRGFDADRKKRAVFGYQYLPYCPLIIALKLSGWRYRDVLEFLYTQVEEFTEISKANRIDNHDLTKMVSYWKKNNLIDFAQVDEQKRKVAGVMSEQKKEPPSYVAASSIGYSKLDFMKALEKRGVMINSELNAIKNYFDEFANKNDLDNLVSRYLSEKSSFIAG
jgi:hypothetical protein